MTAEGFPLQSGHPFPYLGAIYYFDGHVDGTEVCDGTTDPLFATSQTTGVLPLCPKCHKASFFAVARAKPKKAE